MPSVVTIEELIYKGYGLAHDQGKVLLIPYSVPQQTVLYQNVSEKKNYCIAKIDKIVTESSYTRDKKCSAFGSCGGCQWLHIKYSFQKQSKKDIIQSIFKFASVTINSIIFSESEFHYRNKVFFPVGQKGSVFFYGIFKSGTHQIVTHSNCELIPPIFDQIAQEIMSYLKEVKETAYQEETHSGNVRHIGFRINKKGNILVIIVTRKRKLSFTKQLVRMICSKFSSVTGIIQNIQPQKGNTILGDDHKLLYGSDFFIDTIGHIKYNLNYKSFFQINHDIAEKLFSFLHSKINNDEIVIDAYCGVGAISLSLASKAKKIIGIELNPHAINDAQKNAELNDIVNADFFSGKVEDILPEIKLKSIDTIIFDPPRKGLDSKIIEFLSSFLIKKLIYVSCHPQTQKRDVLRLQNIGYKIIEIQPFDMFPQTYHIENVIIMNLS